MVRLCPRNSGVSIKTPDWVRVTIWRQGPSGLQILHQGEINFISLTTLAPLLPKSCPIAYLRNHQTARNLPAHNNCSTKEHNFSVTPRKAWLSIHIANAHFSCPMNKTNSMNCGRRKLIRLIVAVKSTKWVFLYPTSAPAATCCLKMTKSSNTPRRSKCKTRKHTSSRKDSTGFVGIVVL